MADASAASLVTSRLRTSRLDDLRPRAPNETMRALSGAARAPRSKSAVAGVVCFDAGGAVSSHSLRDVRAPCSGRLSPVAHRRQPGRLRSGRIAAMLARSRSRGRCCGLLYPMTVPVIIARPRNPRCAAEADRDGARVVVMPCVSMRCYHLALWLFER